MKYIVVDSGNESNLTNLIKDGEIYDIDPKHIYEDTREGPMIHVNQTKKVSISITEAVRGQEVSGTYYMRRFQLFFDCSSFFESL